MVEIVVVIVAQIVSWRQMSDFVLIAPMNLTTTTTKEVVWGAVCHQHLHCVPLGPPSHVSHFPYCDVLGAVRRLVCLSI